MKVFDRNRYANPPGDNIRQVIERLGKLGPAVVAVRGTGFSANLLGTISMGDDNGDPVLRVDGCDCHVHVMWGYVHSHRLEQEDVGFGPEPVVYLVDKDSKPVVNLFYPKKTYAEVEAALDESTMTTESPKPEPDAEIVLRVREELDEADTANRQSEKRAQKSLKGFVESVIKDRTE